MRKQDFITIFIFFGTLLGGALLCYVIIGLLLLHPKHLTLDFIKAFNLIPVGAIGVTLFVPAAILFVSKQRRLIPIKKAQETIDSLQSQIESEINTATLYASFYRVAKFINEAKDAGIPIPRHEIEGRIAYEFLNVSDPHYDETQKTLANELKEECIKLWKSTL